MYTDLWRTCTPIPVFHNSNAFSDVYLLDNDNIVNSSLYIGFGTQYVGTTFKIIVIVKYINE